MKKDINEFIRDSKNLTLADILINGRDFKNISQRELARRTNIDNASISRIENGTTKKPDFYTMQVLATTLGIKDMYLFLKSANYNDEECESLGYNKEIEYTEILGQYTEKDYIYKDTKMPNVIEMLEDYKKGVLSLGEILGLIFTLTGRDLTEYISEDDKKKYNIKSLIVEHKRK